MRLLDLHADELAMLDLLDEGITEDERIGISFDTLTPPQIRAWKELWIIGLADYVDGWHDKQWLILTKRGRELKRTGVTT